VTTVMKFRSKHFLAVFIRNNKKWIENYAEKVWVQNIVILGWFATWSSLMVFVPESVMIF